MRSLPLVLVANLLGCSESARDGRDSAIVPDSDVADVVLGDVRECSAPLERASWTEVGAAMGLRPSPDEAGLHGAGGTLAVYDFSGDGALDLFLTYPYQRVYYARAADHFEAHVQEGPPSTFLLNLADLDDGQERLQLVSGGNPALAFRVEDGAVVSRTLFELESAGRENGAQGLYPADLDADGDTDFFALQADTSRRDFLIYGNGDGWFTGAQDALPEGTGYGHGFDALWFDWDCDGDLDVYVVNDEAGAPGPNTLYENDHGVMRDASDRCACNLGISGMGVDLADWNEDGIADLYLTEASGAALLEGSADGLFTDATVASGIEGMGPHEMGWGAVWVDIDNDGWLDILEPMGDLWTDPEAEPERVEEMGTRLHHQVNGRFVEASAEFGFDRLGSWRSVVAIDHNGDGVVDPLITGVADPPMFFLSDGCTADGWLEVVAPPHSKVEVTADGHTQTQWVSLQSGMGGAKPPIVHFGLGSAQVVDRLEVTTPDGTCHPVEGPFDARRVVTVAGQAL